MLYYDEIFCSIQGESTLSGLPCLFIRLWGCPVGCSYCDQPQKKEDRKRISIGNIVQVVNKKYNKWVKHICITGGEPLIYDETLPLVYELQSLGYNVSIETSGCVPIEEMTYRRSYKYVMDIKCPSSGVQHKNIYENLIKLQNNDEVKFVIKDRTDYDFMKEVLRKYPNSTQILLSPMFSPEGKAYIGHDLASWVIEDQLDVRLQIQLHKILEVK